MYEPKLKLVSIPPNPNTLMYFAMRNDHSFLNHNYLPPKDEAEYESLLLKHCVKYGHWGVLEHISLSFYLHGWPHETIMKLRTHRHFSFDVMSGRHVWSPYVRIAVGRAPVEEAFYISPRLDPEGQEYLKAACLAYCKEFDRRFTAGMPVEVCRMGMPENYRQNAVVTGSLRSWFHLLDVRSTADNQSMMLSFSEQLMDALCKVFPVVGEWYREKRYKRNNLSP